MYHNSFTAPWLWKDRGGGKRQRQRPRQTERDRETEAETGTGTKKRAKWVGSQNFTIPIKESRPLMTSTGFQLPKILPAPIVPELGTKPSALGL